MCAWGCHGTLPSQNFQSLVGKDLRLNGDLLPQEVGWLSKTSRPCQGLTQTNSCFNIPLPSTLYRMHESIMLLENLWKRNKNCNVQSFDPTPLCNRPLQQTPKHLEVCPQRCKWHRTKQCEYVPVKKEWQTIDSVQQQILQTISSFIQQIWHFWQIYPMATNTSSHQAWRLQTYTLNLIA